MHLCPASIGQKDSTPLLLGQRLMGGTGACHILLDEDLFVKHAPEAQVQVLEQSLESAQLSPLAQQSSMHG